MVISETALQLHFGGPGVTNIYGFLSAQWFWLGGWNSCSEGTEWGRLVTYYVVGAPGFRAYTHHRSRARKGWTSMVNELV
jgi:hypothetical protein